MVLQTLATIGGGLRRTLADSSPTVTRDPFQLSRGYHALLRSYFENEMFSDAAMWQTYRARHRLPRGVRAIYNPTRRVCDWMAGRVYGGAAWTEDGRPLPDGTPHVLQFPSDVIESKPQLVIAGLQALNWGNWQAQKSVYVREAAVTGTAFVEIVDDMDRRKVYPEIVPIERVSSVDLDATGNVKAYEIEYRALDEKGMAFDYRKTVDRDWIREYRNRAVLSEARNPYGFVAAAWVKHRNTGSVFGAPAIAGVIPKIDEINRLATDVHNYIAKLQKQPVVFYGQAAPAPSVRRGASDEGIVLDDSDSISWLHSTDANGRVEPMMQLTANIGDAGTRIDRLMEEIEADLPELTLDRELRAMSQVTGPGADRMMGDVRGRFDEVQANADAGTVKLIQMGVAIAGWRIAQGFWGKPSQLSRHQAKFVGFDLESYASGDLDISLMPRPLIPSTEQERLMALELRKAVASLSDNEVRRALGMKEDEINLINIELAAQVETQTVASF
jgi:hypothetical protein